MNEPIALPQIIEALQRLQDDPERLAAGRRRYSESPPPYRSGESTQAPSPQPRPLSKKGRRIQRQLNRRRSTPFYQFWHQWLRDRRRIVEQTDRRRERRKYTLPYQTGRDFVDCAQENVRSRWIEQGIWKDEWTLETVGGRWKHEEPPAPPYHFSPEPSPPITDTLGRLISKKQERRTLSTVPTEEQSAAHERETASSRPYHQFLYQVLQEREWLEDELYSGIIDFDLEAYKNVKKDWIYQKIWNPEWDGLPGDKWMHEGPYEELELSSGDTTPEGQVRLPPVHFNDISANPPVRRNIFPLPAWKPPEGLKHNVKPEINENPSQRSSRRPSSDLERPSDSPWRRNIFVFPESEPNEDLRHNAEPEANEDLNQRSSDSEKAVDSPVNRNIFGFPTLESTQDLEDHAKRGVGQTMTTVSNQSEIAVTAEDRERGSTVSRQPAKQMYISSAIVANASPRKRKRGRPGASGHNDDPPPTRTTFHAEYRQPKRARYANITDHPPEQPSKENHAKPNATPKLLSKRRNSRNIRHQGTNVKAEMKISQRRQPQSIVAGVTESPGLRRSPRIQARQGTSRRTVYDKTKSESKPRRQHNAAQQKPVKPRRQLREEATDALAARDVKRADRQRAPTSARRTRRKSRR